MNSKVLFCVLFLCTNVGAANAQPAGCNAQFVNALRTTYSNVKSSTVAKALREASCKSNSSANSSGVGVSAFGYGELSFSQAGANTSEACYEKDDAFFSSNSSNLTYSLLPQSAISAIRSCFGGLSLGITPGEDVVAIKTSYIDTSGSGRLAKVRDISVTPSNALSCPKNILKVGDEIIPGGTTIPCERLRTDTTISITLNTDVGSKSVWLKKIPKVVRIPYNWTYRSRAGRPETLCMIRGDGPARPAGGWVNCNADGVCGNVSAIRGLCIYRHGKGRIDIDGKDYLWADVWDYSSFKGQPHTQCIKNGEKVGVRHNCKQDNSCGNATAIVGLCADRYN